MMDTNDLKAEVFGWKSKQVQRNAERRIRKLAAGKADNRLYEADYWGGDSNINKDIPV